MKLQYLRNKKVFSHRGVILEVEGPMIKICHIPYCGMDQDTARKLSIWLHRRAFDLERREANQICKETKQLLKKLRADGEAK